MIKVDQYTCGQYVFFSLHNGENENDLKNMLKSYKLSKLSGRIVFFNAYDATGKIWPQLCLKLTDAEEIYDYDYDDNLQYSGLEEYLSLRLSTIIIWTQTELRRYLLKEMRFQRDGLTKISTKSQNSMKKLVN